MPRVASNFKTTFGTIVTVAMKKGFGKTIAHVIRKVIGLQNKAIPGCKPQILL
jgi:hypothetical protein